MELLHHEVKLHGIPGGSSFLWALGATPSRSLRIFSVLSLSPMYVVRFYGFCVVLPDSSKLRWSFPSLSECFLFDFLPGIMKLSFLLPFSARIRCTQYGSSRNCSYAENRRNWGLGRALASILFQNLIFYT